MFKRSVGARIDGVRVCACVSVPEIESCDYWGVSVSVSVREIENEKYVWWCSCVCVVSVCV